MKLDYLVSAVQNILPDHDSILNIRHIWVPSAASVPVSEFTEDRSTRLGSQRDNDLRE